MWERLKRSRLFFIASGIVFIVDGIGRIETVAELYKSAKSWLASRSDIHLAWPPHTLVAVGVFFLVLGLISFIWPKRLVLGLLSFILPKYELKDTPNPSPPLDKPAPQRTDTHQASVPHVDLIFELPKNHDTSPGWLVRDEEIKVVNTSNVVAYDVSIQPKESHLYKAEFKTIARLEKDHPAYVEMDLRAKPSGTFYRQFEALLKFELENSSEDDSFNVRVPMIVQFYDDKKKVLYQTTHEVIYNTFWLDAQTHLVEGTTPIKTAPPLPDTAALVNTGPGPNKLLVKRIMRGTEKLMAWEIVRDGFPNAFFVEFSIRNLEPKSCVTSDHRVANGEWHEWYKEWKQQPGGFGGASGDGLDGTLPW
jgi:hypothetical protein